MCPKVDGVPPGDVQVVRVSHGPVQRVDHPVRPVTDPSLPVPEEVAEGEQTPDFMCVGTGFPVVEGDPGTDRPHPTLSYIPFIPDLTLSRRWESTNSTEGRLTTSFSLNDVVVKFK